jgi:S-adenosylmethionine synthetase
MVESGYLITSESVSEGHPDKVCDKISDAILDAMIAQDPMSRVACETMAGMGFIIVTGEVTTKAHLNYDKLIRGVIKEIGYDRPELGFDYNTVGILNSIHEQSTDIAQGVRKTASKEQGAGDQGMMSGYACNESKELMPLPILLAHKLARRLTEVRKKGILKYLRPDGKTQVSIEYDEDNKPKRIEAIVLSTQHDPDVTLAKIKKDVMAKVIEPICEKYIDKNTKYFINRCISTYLIIKIFLQ